MRPRSMPAMRGISPPPPFELVGGESVGKFVNTTAAPLVTADTTPKAEKANYLDLGISRKLLPELTIGLDTYYKRSRNLIDEGQFGAPIILTPFNYASGKQYGAELSATYRDGPWSAYANFSASLAEGLDIVTSQFSFAPDDLAYIAQHYIHLDHDQTYSASAGTSYRWHDTTMSVDLIYGSGLRSDGDHPNGTSLPDYAQVNLGVVQAFELPYAGTVRARFDIVNLFDEDTRSATAPSWVSARPSSGRGAGSSSASRSCSEEAADAQIPPDRLAGPRHVGRRCRGGTRGPPPATLVVAATGSIPACATPACRRCSPPA